MPAPAKEGEVLQSQLVYFKIRVDVTTTKQLLKRLDQLQLQHTKGNADAKVKRALICGRDQTIYHTVDLLQGLSDAEIDGPTHNLTPSQRVFILQYCRELFNGIGILQGPAGAGKTTVIKTPANIANMRGLKVAIVTDSNSAADNVVEVIADKSYIAVRLHSLGLERHHLLKDSRKGIDKSTLLPADPEPPPQG